MSDLRTKPWWTPADRAELDVLMRELVAVVFSHRDAGCETCAAGYPPCPRVQGAIAVVVEWRAARILLSRAKWERARQDRIDELALEEAGRL